MTYITHIYVCQCCFITESGPRRCAHLCPYFWCWNTFPISNACILDSIWPRKKNFEMVNDYPLIRYFGLAAKVVVCLNLY